MLELGFVNSILLSSLWAMLFVNDEKRCIVVIFFDFDEQRWFQKPLYIFDFFSHIFSKKNTDKISRENLSKNVTYTLHRVVIEIEEIFDVFRFLVRCFSFSSLRSLHIIHYMFLLTNVCSMCSVHCTLYNGRGERMKACMWRVCGESKEKTEFSHSLLNPLAKAISDTVQHIWHATFYLLYKLQAHVMCLHFLPLSSFWSYILCVVCSSYSQYMGKKVLSISWGIIDFFFTSATVDWPHQCTFWYRILCMFSATIFWFLVSRFLDF